MKYLITIFCIVTTALHCLVLCASQASAAGSRPPQKTDFVIVAPARVRIIQLAHDLADMRNITLVSFRKDAGTSKLSLYVWGVDGWRYVNREDFSALKFMRGTPDMVLVIGDDKAVPKELFQYMVWPSKIERIKGGMISDFVNGLNEYFHFSPREWKKLARAHNLTLSQLGSHPKSVSYTARRPAVKIEDIVPVKKIKPVPEKVVKEEIVAEIVTDKKVIPEKKAESEERKDHPDRGIRLNLGEDINMVFIRLEALSIWVGRDEVTNDQYERFDLAHDPKKYFNNVINLTNQPVVMVSWEDAVNYCSWLNRNFNGQLPPGCKIRLPTEKEWIAFALCGLEKKYPWGNQWPPPDSFNYKGVEGSGMFYNIFHNEKFIRSHNDGFVVAAPVGENGINEWGLYGVGGNVWEWCHDWFDETETTRILKGAAWNNFERAFMTITNQSAALPDKSNAMIGFRVIIAPTKKIQK